MTWSTRFRIRQYLKGSIWLVPFMGGVLGAVLGLLEPRVDESVSLPQAWQYSPSTASTVLAAIIGAMAALTGFVVTVTVLVVQMRSTRSRLGTCACGTGTGLSKPCWPCSSPHWRFRSRFCAASSRTSCRRSA